MEPHRWVGTGRIVFNNKGNPVKQYEPYFSITHQFEDDLQIVQIGVSPEIFYDALGRNIKTVMPDGTFTKVVYHPWHQELWDAGDTVIDSAWYSTRQALGIVDPYHPDYIASEKSKAYANTPQLIYFDNLGRTVCNQEHIFNDPDDIDDVFVYTQLKLDIEGNLMNVIDGLDRECMAFKYNMLGQRLYQTHIDSGERWNMTNAMGKPLWQLNSKGTIFTFTYDVLNRPLDFIADDGVSSITYQKMQYGEGEINAHLLNLNGKLLDLRDGSGEQGFKEYDFKGNVIFVSKGFVEVVGNLPDWSSAVDMASGGLNSITLYDALNRPITIDAGDKTTKYTYNEAGLPETVIVDDGSDNLIVENISYNAKGQREFIGFGNDTYSEYFYDEKTFRLKRIITQRDADTEPLQDINYVYDAVGNIVYVKDNAQQTFYFDNSIINPESFYTYDALYRLIEATGRENFNNTGFYEVTTPQGLGGNDVQNYERSFEYDLVGNITKMQHAASANSFTKHFHYDNDNNQLTRIFIGSSVSPLESYTYDEHGNMLASNDRQFTYNLLDQLQVVDITGGSWKAIYMYNAEGQRDRKIILNSAGTKDRAFFQNYELYREFDNADDLVLERLTHHITDGEKKVATLDQETGSNTKYRYQYGNNLGSVGLELDDSAGIISYEEYYPFGGTAYYAHNHHIDVPLKRYKYCGKEQDEETGLYYYGARYYAPWLCRFTSVDPKALEYVHQSTYVFADNNPIVKYDVNGEGTNGEIENIHGNIENIHASNVISLKEQIENKKTELNNFLINNPNSPCENIDEFVKSLGIIDLENKLKIEEEFESEVNLYIETLKTVSYNEYKYFQNLYDKAEEPVKTRIKISSEIRTGNVATTIGFGETSVEDINQEIIPSSGTDNGFEITLYSAPPNTNAQNSGRSFNSFSNELGDIQYFMTFVKDNVSKTIWENTVNSDSGRYNEIRGAGWSSSIYEEKRVNDFNKYIPKANEIKDLRLNVIIKN